MQKKKDKKKEDKKYTCRRGKEVAKAEAARHGDTLQVGGSSKKNPEKMKKLKLVCSL